MSADGTIFDLGYRPYEGEYLGRRGSRWAVIKDGMRKVMGLRRRARSKIMPWSLVAIALLPAIVFIGIGVIGGEAVDDELFGHADYFELTGPIALIFVALAAAELLIPDRIDGTFQVYASRPLTTLDYLGAKASALALLVAGFMLLPQLLLWIGFAAISSDGFGSHLVGNADELARAVLAIVVYLAAFLPIAFVVASYANRTAISAAAFTFAFFATAPLTAVVVDQGGPDWVALGSLDHHPRFVRDWIFGVDLHPWIPERAGFEAWVSLAVILAIAAVSTYLVARRYRRLP